MHVLLHWIFPSLFATTEGGYLKVDSNFSGHFDTYLIGTLALNHTMRKKLKSEQNTKMSHFYQRFCKASYYRLL